MVIWLSFSVSKYIYFKLAKQGEIKQQNDVWGWEIGRLWSSFSGDYSHQCDPGHSLIRSLIRSLIHSLTLSFILSFVLTHSFTHSFSDSLTHSFSQSFSHSFSHSFIHSLFRCFLPPLQPVDGGLGLGLQTRQLTVTRVQCIVGFLQRHLALLPLLLLLSYEEPKEPRSIGAELQH